MHLSNPAPVPWSRDKNGQLRADLPALTRSLIVAGGSNIIAPPSIIHDPSPADAFEALAAAARSFELAPGVTLAEHFWDHPGDLRRGTVAARLRTTTQARGKHIPGFLAVYATHVRSPLAYGPQRMPLRVIEAIEVPEGVGGPFLILVMCRLLANNTAGAVQGWALPILSGRRFVPVFSQLERDILQGLIGLQGALDRHGVDCTIERMLPEPAENVGHDLHIAIARDQTVIRELRLGIESDGPADENRSRHRACDFVIDVENWRDGPFISWLEAAILG